MQLGSLLLLRAICRSLIRYHSLHHLLRVLHRVVYLVLLDKLGVLVNVLKMHLLDLTLQLLFFLVQLVHIFAHEFFDINVLVSCTHRSLVSTRTMRARSFPAQICWP